jgi:hypothetical protein
MADKNAVSLCSDDQVYVDVEQEADGGIVFVGQDLNPHNAYGGLEYEYRISVDADDIPTLAAALGGTSGEDILDLLRAHREQITRTGELKWVRGLGVAPEFWSHVSE